MPEGSTNDEVDPLTSSQKPAELGSLLAWMSLRMADGTPSWVEAQVVLLMAWGSWTPQLECRLEVSVGSQRTDLAGVVDAERGGGVPAAVLVRRAEQRLDLVEGLLDAMITS
jgi:hypothetical protein